MASKKKREGWDPEVRAAIIRELGGREPMRAKDFPRLYCEARGYEIDLSMNIVEPGLDAEHDATPDEFEQALYGAEDDDYDGKWDSYDDRVEANVKRSRRIGKPTLLELYRELELMNEDFSMGYPQHVLRNALDAYVKEIASEKVQQLVRTLSHDPLLVDDPDVEDDWSRLAVAVFDEPMLSISAQIAMMKGAIWQVKRKLTRRRVFQHYMWVLIGRTNSGKSTFMELFLSPLRDAKKMSMTFNMVLDTRFIGMWTYNFAMVFNEMENARNTDKDMLKNLITSARLLRKPMRTNRDIEVDNNATFFGTSNNHFSEMIRDTTGIRRFIPTDSVDEIDRDTVNGMNWVRLWQSVDEYNPANPIAEFWDYEIVPLQEHHRVKTPVEQWARMMQDHVDMSKLYGEWKSEHDLFAEFQKWERREFRASAKDMTARRYFYEEMQDMETAPDSKWEYDSKNKAYRINPNKIDLDEGED